MTKTISVDIGNGYIKAVSADGRTLHFPSVIRTDTDRGFQTASKNDYRVKIDGAGYFIGDLAVVKKGQRRFDISASYNPDTLLYLALCAHLLTGEEDTEVNVCLGLPYDYYIRMDKGAVMKEHLQGEKVTTEYSGVTKEIAINQVSVYPQGVGAYFYNLYDIDGSAKNGAEEYLKSLFIDIGYRTVDVVGFEVLNGSFELIEEDSFSIDEKGIMSAINHISALAQAAKGYEVKPVDIEFSIRHNNSVYRDLYDEYDLTGLEKIAYQSLTDEIVLQINTKLAGSIRRYRNIFLTGGGADTLQQYFAKAFPMVKVQPDNVFCNAKGYLALESTKVS